MYGYGQPIPRQEVVRINGENGAWAYQLGPNSSILMLDNTAPYVWLKTTDGAGYPTLTAYSITPVEPTKNGTDDYSMLEERIQRLEELLNEKQKSDTTGSKSKQYNGQRNRYNENSKVRNDDQNGE